MSTSPAKTEASGERALLITADDHEQLRRMIDRARLRDPRGSACMDKLEGELCAARVVASSAIPTGVVTMDSRVCLLDLDTGEQMVFTLVLPEKADVDNARLSVLAPIGTAVLGYRVGDVFSWQVPDGVRRLEVLGVQAPVGDLAADPSLAQAAP